MSKINKIAKKLVKLNIKEVNKLYNILEKKYNIKYNINTLNNNISTKEVKTNEINQEKISSNNSSNSSFYDIYLKSLGTVKLPVIKLINNITGVSLTESKKLIDNIPSLIKKSIALEEAKKIQEDFKKVDAEIELKISK
ncbi:MAG: ribosomal protein L7/L12 [Candidatus Shikimatogenerans bostrichidophilus]|nr:MAG: ribosomal protein L7/L12 [Candidatus Shikimatogenerans bostrichidophilus]